MQAIATGDETSTMLPVGNTKAAFSAIFDNPNLPSPPAIVLQIVEKASQPECHPNEIAALLQRDPGLSSQVLRTVNSGLFGLSKPVSAIDKAVRLLGTRQLRSLVLSVALPTLHRPDRDPIVVRYWHESVVGAVVARELATLLRRPNPEDDFIAGLLRDVGIVVLRDTFTDDYRKLYTRASASWSTRQCDEEQDEFGIHHAEISAAIIDSWHLPAEICQPIQFHHHPEDCGNAPAIQDRAWLLAFASKVAILHTDSASNVNDVVRLAQRHFRLTQEALNRFLTSLTPAIQEFAALLKIDIGECPNYAAIVNAGCQELVRLAVSTNKETPVGNASAGELGKTSAWDTGTPTARAEGALALPDFDSSCLDRIPPGGVRLDGYTITEILGRGGMGVVFKAHDPALDRVAAIKMLTAEGVARSEYRDWFKREARVAAAIQHENVVTIYAISEFNGLPYLAMEFLSQTSLQDRLDQSGPLPFKAISRVGRQIAKGLAAAHKKRIIHRDVKPANVLFTRDGDNVKLSDFGLARACDDAYKSQRGQFVGTPLYMSPEQFNTGEVDQRTDLFSFGSLLYAMCAGKPPFMGNTIPVLMKQICQDPVPALRSHRADAPAWLVGLISKLLAKNPAARLQTADEVVRAFELYGAIS